MSASGALSYKLSKLQINSIKTIQDNRKKKEPDENFRMSANADDENLLMDDTRIRKNL